MTESPHSEPAPRVVHISVSDLQGGACIAAFRLHHGLSQVGAESRMLVRRRFTNRADVIAAQSSKTFVDRIRKKMRTRRFERVIEGIEIYYRDGFDKLSDDRAADDTDLVAQLPPHDLVHLHFISDFVDQPSFFAQLPPSTPLVWTLHDMSAFTGGCHYDNHCGRFQQSCGACPQMQLGREADFSREIFLRKEAQLARRSPHNTAFVADSYWLRDEAKKSALLSRFPVSTIHYGLDTQRFRPLDQTFARDLFDVPQDAFVVVFAAASVRLKRKGFQVLLDALGRLRGMERLHLLVVGEASRELPDDIPHTVTGYCSDERLMALLYSAANCLVIPSLMEAFGQTSLEAMACGTPVVGFDTGGIPDMITHGETGLLAPVGDGQALADCIRRFHDDPDFAEQVGRQARARVERDFQLQRQAHDYLALYRQILAGQTAT